MPAPLTSPKSSHTSDPLLRPFLGPTFDPTAYLNAHIPALAFPTPAQPVLPLKHQTLPDVASSTSTHIAQLAAQLSRLCDTLTTLTDDILRGAPRLAYSVELLRGDANALADGLRESLAGDVETFVPGGLDAALAELKASEEAAVAATAAAAALAEPESGEVEEQATAANRTFPNQSPIRSQEPSAVPADPSNPAEPVALARLRTLHTVRSRLGEVTAVFDRALAWPLPPSSRSLGASSFVSVSAPGPEDARLEEQGLEAQRLMREGVTDLLGPPSGKGGENGRGAAEGVVMAEKRMVELRELCEVWKGTAEEKPRTRFVDGLAKLVADRRREEEQKGNLRKVDDEELERERQREGEGLKEGLLSGFRRLREEIYLE